MKKVVVLSPKAYQDNIIEIFNDLTVPIFSKFDIEGYKNNDEQADIRNWFGGGKESDFSVMFFAFVSEEVANSVLDAIEKWNNENEKSNPMHAFMVAVERSV